MLELSVSVDEREEVRRGDDLRHSRGITRPNVQNSESALVPVGAKHMVHIDRSRLRKVKRILFRSDHSAHARQFDRQIRPVGHISQLHRNRPHPMRRHERTSCGRAIRAEVPSEHRRMNHLRALTGVADRNLDDAGVGQIPGLALHRTKTDARPTIGPFVSDQRDAVNPLALRSAPCKRPCGRHQATRRIRSRRNCRGQYEKCRNGKATSPRLYDAHRQDPPDLSG